MADPSYAVLFKTHFWDGFAERQYGRLCACAGTREVYIIVDETHGPVGGIRHDRVVRMTRATSRREGYGIYPHGNVFWHNTDYQIYHFLDRRPHFEFVVVAEYDVVADFDIRGMVCAMARDGLALVAQRIPEPESQWPWARTVRPYYPPEIEIFGRLLCLSAYSRPFARAMQEQRRAHLGRLAHDRESGRPIWPFGEALVGAEIVRQGLREAELGEFADVSRYDWAPARPEFALRGAAAPMVAHPVLDGDRFLAALAKVGWEAADLFREGSALRAWLAPLDAAEVVALFLRRFAGDAAGLASLRDYARERGVIAESVWDVARGKPATQSSVSAKSRRPGLAEDAAGAVNGGGFETAAEAAPWWCVDLEAVAPIREIRLRGDAESPHGLSVAVSSDLVSWREVWRQDGVAPVEGEWRIALAEPVSARFVRVSAAGEQSLRLERVEVLV